MADYGFDTENLKRDDLISFEEFHIRGREATVEMIQLASVTDAMKVLDIGCGIGGPARTLAHECDCHVTGIDLTEEFINAAKELSQRVGLAEKTSFLNCSALDLPFEDKSFDLAWMVHVNMNVPDKATLLSEAFRVLKPGATLAVYEIFAAQDGALPEYPVPWADRAEISFLTTPETFRNIARQTGFVEESWRDVREQSAKWFANMLNSPPPEKPKLTLSLINGSDFSSKARNVLTALEDRRLTVAQAKFTRPSS
ncbi:MAG: class I SAM-dependent methyltransferase [Candidatus Zixiibacteriota bacterium]